MLKVLDCVLDAHDRWLVTLAASVCALSCLTASEFLRHAQAARRYSQAMLAEGVEEEVGLSFLRRESRAAAQGYLIGRPAPIARFAHLTQRPDPAAAMRRVA